jgi:hypothetical protein
MTKKTDITETRAKFDRLFKAMKDAENELSRLNLLTIQQQEIVDTFDKQVGTGEKRVSDFIEASEKLSQIKDERNRANAIFQDRRDEFLKFKDAVSNGLFSKAVEMYESILPEHTEVLRRVSQWREFVTFLTTHFISRRTRKLVGFRVGQSSVLPQSIFSEEDTEAVETLKLFISGTLEPEITKLDNSSGTVKLRQKKVQAL